MFPNGARLQLFGADKPDSLRGIGFSGIGTCRSLSDILKPASHVASATRCTELQTHELAPTQTGVFTCVSPRTTGNFEPNSAQHGPPPQAGRSGTENWRYERNRLLLPFHVTDRRDSAI